MENASKALLIAGSVLIAILLIAMGVRIFNSTKGTSDSAESTMNAAEIATFNNKFTTYVGNNKTKAQAISLLNQIIINNSSNNNHTIYLSFVADGTTSGALNTVSDLTNVLNGTAYEDSFAKKNSFTIRIEYDANGYVQLIKLL